MFLRILKKDLKRKRAMNVISSSFVVFSTPCLRGVDTVALIGILVVGITKVNLGHSPAFK